MKNITCGMALLASLFVNLILLAGLVFTVMTTSQCSPNISQTDLEHRAQELQQWRDAHQGGAQ